MIFKSALCAGLIGLAALATPAGASAVFDFEGFANNVEINSLTAGGITATVTGTENGVAGPASIRIFNTLLASNVPNDPDLVSTTIPGGDLMSDAFGNVLIIQEGNSQLSPDDSARGGTITFTFDQGVNLLSFDLLDDANLTVSSPGQTSINRIVTVDGGFVSVTGATPLFSNVRELTFSFAESGAIDNLIVAPVPVPAALPLLAAGLGALGLMRRRRKTA